MAEVGSRSKVTTQNLMHHITAKPSLREYPHFWEEESWYLISILPFLTTLILLPAPSDNRYSHLEEAEVVTTTYFATRDKTIYWSEICKLVCIWERSVGRSGEYLTDWRMLRNYLSLCGPQGSSLFAVGSSFDYAKERELESWSKAKKLFQLLPHIFGKGLWFPPFFLRRD